MILEFPNLKEEENDTTNSVIDKENKKRGVFTSGSYDKDTSILTISFCINDNCCAFCSFKYKFSYMVKLYT
jgi:hypothetical protein